MQEIRRGLRTLDNISVLAGLSAVAGAANPAVLELGAHLIDGYSGEGFLIPHMPGLVHDVVFESVHDVALGCWLALIGEDCSSR